MLAAVGIGPVAMDLEADSFHHYREKICLVQVTVGGRHYLLDPLDGARPEALGPVLADPAVCKILHGADYDLRVLHRDHGIEVRGLFDTMVAARLVGARSFGLADLLRDHLDIVLDKAHQRADWSRRPLPDSMLRYAVEDTAHLEALASILENRLSDLGRRSWADEEFRALEGVRWSAVGGDPEAFRRVKGARVLDARGLTLLRSLHAHREERARLRDVPPFRILSDAAMVELARRAPATPGELARIRGMPRPLLSGSAARELIEALRAGREAPAVPLHPPGEPPGRRRLAPALRKRVASLRRIRDDLAGRLELEASLLASRRTLEAIAEKLEKGEPWRHVAGLRQWQADLLADAIDRG